MSPIEALNTWKENHRDQCKLNYDGTAPAIEAAGATRIFERSIEERGARYTEYYGDGDSKAYSTVRNIYEGKEVEKFECIGHYQKRVVTRLLKLKKNNKGLGELTKPIIDKLQNTVVNFKNFCSTRQVVNFCINYMMTHI